MSDAGRLYRAMALPARVLAAGFTVAANAGCYDALRLGDYGIEGGGGSATSTTGSAPGGADAGGAGGSGIGGATGCVFGSYRELVLCGDPIAYFEFETLSALSLVENSAESPLVGELVTVEPGSSSPFAGVVGSGLQFSDNASVNVTEVNKLYFVEDEPFSVELWVNLGPPISGDGDFRAKLFVGIPTYWGLQATQPGESDVSTLALSRGPSRLDGALMVAGRFHHLAGVYDPMLGTLVLYQDGQSKSTDASPWTPSASPPTSSLIWAGAEGWAEPITIDEVAVYSRTLSDSEIKQHYLCGAQSECSGALPEP